MNFTTTAAELDFILTIVKRAEAMQPPEMQQTRMDWIMDITACHANGCPLQLSALAAASDADLSHDAFGIRRHIDRRSGKLTDCFMPRYSQVYAVPDFDTAEGEPV